MKKGEEEASIDTDSDSDENEDILDIRKENTVRLILNLVYWKSDHFSSLNKKNICCSYRPINQTDHKG